MADEQVLVLKDGKAFAAFASAEDAATAAEAMGESGTITSVPLYPAGTVPEFSPLYVVQVVLSKTTAAIEREFLEPNQEVPTGTLASISRPEGENGKTVIGLDQTATVTLKGTDIPKVRKAARQIVDQGREGKYTAADKLLNTKISFE